MKKRIQFSIQWHITSRCPNRCKHCYMFTDNYNTIIDNELTYDQLIQVLCKLDQFEEKYNIEIPSFAITGGDPFIRDDFFLFLSELKKRRKNVLIMGIPERVSSENIDALAKLGTVAYQVSLDGLEKKHNLNRGDNSFKKTIDAIQMLSNSKLACLIMFTLHPGNVEDMFELIDFLHSLNVKATFDFDLLVYEGNATTLKENVFSSHELSVIINRYLKKDIDLKNLDSSISLGKKNNMFSVLGAKEEAFEEATNHYAFCGGCYNGLSSIAINSNGDVYPCRRLPITIGNVLIDSFEHLILSNSLMKQFRQRESYKGCDSCKFFHICRGCPAYSYSIYNDPFIKPPYCFLFEPDSRYIRKDVTMFNTSCAEELNIILNTKDNQLLESQVNLITKDKQTLIKILCNNPYMFN